jgi:hypothetical protein
VIARRAARLVVAPLARDAVSAIILRARTTAETVIAIVTTTATAVTLVTALAALSGMSTARHRPDEHLLTIP